MKQDCSIVTYTYTGRNYVTYRFFLNEEETKFFLKNKRSMETCELLTYTCYGRDTEIVEFEFESFTPISRLSYAECSSIGDNSEHTRWDKYFEKLYE